MPKSSIFLFYANVFITSACLKHFNFLTVQVPNAAPHSEVQTQATQMLTRKGGLVVLSRNPSGTLLTATTL